MDFFVWISSAVIFLLVLGFIIGFFRNWVRSLTRLICIGVVVALSIFLAPVISNALLDRFTDGTVISIAGFRLDFVELLSSILDESIINDLNMANGTTNALLLSLMNVAVNVVIFFGIFILLSLLTLIVYWIVFAIVGSKGRKERKNRKLYLNASAEAGATANEPTDQNKDSGKAKYWILKVVSGFIGLVSMAFIMFAFLNPLFGAMNICNKFVEENANQTANAYSRNIEIASASALPENLISGHLYYKEDEKIGKVENYIEIYADVKDAYDHSAAGFIFNTFGISKLGTLSFNYLTEVEHNGLKFNMSNELISIVKIYNGYKDTFVKNEFKLEDNNSIDGIINIYDISNESEIAKGYVTELLPVFCERWSEGQAFLGIDPPVQGQFEKSFYSLLKVFATKDNNIISNNIKVLLNAIKIANNENNKLIASLNNGVELYEYFENNTTLIKEEILNLSTSAEFRNNMPIIFGNLIEVVYEMILGEPKELVSNELPASKIAEINWNTEAKVLQKMINNLVSISNSLSSEDGINGNLSKFGGVIDSARTSKMLNGPLETLLLDMINSSKLGLDDNIKETIQTAFADHWEKSVDEYSFETMFETIEKTTEVADKLLSGDANFADLEEVLLEVVDSDELKNTIKDALEKDVIGNMFGEENKQSADLLSGILEGFVTSENATKESLKSDISAVQTIINFANAQKKGESNLLPEENSQENADKAIESLASSKLSLEILQKAQNGDGEYIEIKNITSGTSTSDKEYLSNSIEKLEDTETKTLLKNIFGII